MCSFDNKRFLLDDNISSLAYGHYSITNKTDIEEVASPIQSLTLTRSQVFEKRIPGFAYTGQLRKPVEKSKKVDVAIGIHGEEVGTSPLPLVPDPIPEEAINEIPNSPTRNDAHELWTDESSMGSNEEDSIFDSEDEAEEVEVRFDETEVEEAIGEPVKKSSRKRVSSEEDFDAPLRKLKNY